MLTSLPQRNRGNYLDKYANTKLSTNLYKVNFKESTKVYIYAFKSQPDIPSQNVKKVRNILMASRSIVQRLIGPYTISGRTVFGSKVQQMAKGTEINFKLQFEGCSYQAIFKLVREVTIGDILSGDIHKSGVVFSFLNNMVKNFFHQLGYSQIGKSRKYFDSQHYKNLDNAQVTIFKGYSSSFTLLESGLYLRMDPAVKIVRADSVLSYINYLYKVNASLSKEEKRNVVEAQLVGKMVMANYGKNKYYTIQSILFETSIDVFTFNNGTQKVNLLQYYKTTYDIEITNKKQPLVKVIGNKKDKQNKKSIVLIPELLLMSGLPEDFDQRKRREISDQTIVAPSQKAIEIEQIFNRFCESNENFNPNTVAEKLGIKLETKPTKIQGKQLGLPELQLGNKQRIEEHKTTNFMLFNKPLYKSDVTMKIVLMHPNDFDLQAVKSLMSSTCANLKIEYKLITKEVKYQDIRTASRALERIISDESANGGNMFWFVIPSSFKNNYSIIKKLVLKSGVQKNSQVTVASTFQKKGFNSVFTKILLQMAAKVGNKLWVPKVPAKILSSGVLMIGIETYADSINKGNMVLSYCGNTNKQFSSFYSNFIVHPKNDGIKTQSMRQIVLSCLNEYLICSREAPKDVIIMKNGSTKFEILAKSEVEAIKQVFQSLLKKGEQMHLVYILMDKDANQKFFTERGNQTVNPSSGMLINSEAVGKGFEFYLIAQHCNRGTVKPTFYKVLYSDTFLEEGVIEELIFTQCFNYMNWTGSIKVPSVLQYAKKLSMFVGQYMSDEKVGSNLHNNLYYI